MSASLFQIRIKNCTIWLLFVLMLPFSYCTQNKKFDKTGWQEKGDLYIYPNRNAMLQDLTANHQLKGLSYKQLIDLLGEPEAYTGTKPYTVYYNVVTDYGADIDPVYVKHLILSLSTDSTVLDFKIEEIKP